MHPNCDKVSVLLTSLGKMFLLVVIFCSDRPYLFRNHWCFYSCSLSSNIYSKINFITENGSDLCNFNSKLDFWIFFFIKNIILLFFANFKLLEIHKDIVKISDIFNQCNLLKTCIQTILSLSAYFAAIFTMGKMKIFDFFFKTTH